jgi:hypothetical protein
VLRFAAQCVEGSGSGGAALGHTPKGAAASDYSGGYAAASQAAARAFVVAFHCADQSFAALEVAAPNSGRRGGPFLARMRYKKHVPLPGSLHPRGSVLSR